MIVSAWRAPLKRGCDAMFAFDLPWALALWPLPLVFFWVLPAYRDQSEAVRAPFFARLVDITGAAKVKMVPVSEPARNMYRNSRLPLPLAAVPLMSVPM